MHRLRLRRTRSEGRFSHGSADLPAGDRAPLGGAQPLDPAIPAGRELASLERGRPDARHPHHDRVQVPAALRRARARGAAGPRFSDVRVSPPVLASPVRRRPFRRRRSAPRSGRLLRRVFPIPLRENPVLRRAHDPDGDGAPADHGPSGTPEGRVRPDDRRRARRPRLPSRIGGRGPPGLVVRVRAGSRRSPGEGRVPGRPPRRDDPLSRPGLPLRPDPASGIVIRMARLATGISGFDAMVQGGLPAGSSVVLQGPPGQEKLRFALTFLAEGLRAGGSALVVTASQSPDAVVAELRGLGVDLDSVTNENRLRIVDWYSWSEETVHDIEERGIVIRSSIDLTNLGVALSRAIAALAGDGPRRAVIELLSPATSSYEVTQVYAFAQSAKRKFDRHQFTSLVLLEKEMHSNPQLTTLHQPFDGVIEIARSRSGDRIIRKIGVLHLKDTAPDPTFRVLEMTEAGMRVVADPAKPAEPGSVGRGRVLESQDERAQRLRLILQIATERLKLNPRDADALFAMAAAQATLDDAKGGLETLDRLAQIDSAYPGLWVLKTKLHAKLGQADLARLSRVRAFESEPEAAKVIDATVPCPMCDAPVAIDATSCANCGVKFTPTRTLEDELDDLGHAAIQEMVEEGLGEEKSRAKPVDKPPSPPPKSPEERPPTRPAKPIEATPSKRGLTNGLLLGRRGAPKAGRTNGLRGRTNGLRGRTNGLTNGLGRTNGLTNGLGRTNGLTNGLGRTNGLTNGLGRTNGLTNGLGRTNGLTYGLGRTNGLTNGL